MICEEDIRNVNQIIEKSKLIYTSDSDQQRLEKIKRELTAVADKYLKEVKNYDRLRFCN